jgi:transposase
MKAVHGAKVKNDKIDSQKIAALLRSGIEDRFTDPMVRTTVHVDAALMDALHKQILAIVRQINALVPEHDPVAVHLLRTIPGVGKILALVIFYEIHDINRFPKVGTFISYARLVKCAHESAGKRRTGKNSKIGNVHLKWALWRCSLSLPPPQRTGQALPQEIGQQIRKGQGALHHRTETRSHRVHHAQKKYAFRCKTVL